MPTTSGDSVRRAHRANGKLVTTPRSVAMAGRHSEPLEQRPLPARAPARGDAQTAGPVAAMSNGDRGPAALLGRRHERNALDRLLERVWAGKGQVLVLRGEPGVGTSALLEYLVGRSSGCRVARAAGVESEMELAYAGLHQLCAPVLELRERLPAPQRDALATAFGLSAEPPSDRFVVGLALLGLLSQVAGERPLVCVVDDAQWLDKASALALAFAARRLQTQPIGLVLAVHAPGEVRELSGLPELEVGGLSDADARALLDSVLLGRLDERVRDRVVSESRGNPLTLLEFARGLAPAQRAGGFALPDVMPSVNRIEQRFAPRLESLPIQTRRLLLLAAAEPLGDVSVLWRAAGRLGLGADAAAPAQDAGLLDIGARVRFRHPLVRPAVYRGASPPDRRQAHRALAEATDPEVDPDRRAWHRAHAANGPNEDVAAELERSAGRAAARGGVAAAAAFLGRATELTPDPASRGRRALNAAQTKLQAGGFEQAVSMLVTAETGPLDEVQRARIDLTRARIAFANGRGGEASALLLAAARTLEPLDVGLARETYLEAFSAAMLGGQPAGGPGLLEVAQAAREAPPAPHAHKADMLLDALTVRLTDGYAAAARRSAQALRALCDDDDFVQEGPRWLWLASATAADLWDDERWDALSARHVKMAREAGALGELPLALDSRVYVHLFAGELAAAAALVEETQTLSKATGSSLAPDGALAVAAWRGREDAARRLIDAATSEVVAGGDRIGLTVTQWASALLSNGLGRYEDALAAAREAAKSQQELSTPNWGAIELIEAAARSGATGLAADALERLSETTRASGTDWALGVEARARALLSGGAAADELYRQAIERLGRTRLRPELARAHLLYGEWQRRENRRVDAREQLRTAYELFAAIGMEAFAERARRELLATGEKVRRRLDETRDQLTPQEEQIARLARDGLSNSEIGAQLFISPRTVEWHLYKVFAKLAISSRKALHGALLSRGRQADLTAELRGHRAHAGTGDQGLTSAHYGRNGSRRARP
jgi:DNA-binding CsgD family transcriptional regulator